jgi:hypothetical protein
VMKAILPENDPAVERIPRRAGEPRRVRLPDHPRLGA